MTLHSIHPETRAFLDRGTHGLWIDSKFAAAATGQTIPVYSPSTGETIGRLAAGEAPDIDLAVAAARLAFQGAWSGWSAYDRQALLFRAYDLLDRRFDELAEVESIDMGAPISRTRATKPAAFRMVQFFAAQALNIKGETLPNGLGAEFSTMTLRAPVGIIGGIIPWNGALTSLWWIIGAVLATGCTCVLKPATEASLTTLRLAEMLASIGVPAGVINVVTGNGATAGDALARHPDVDRIAFTGSTHTGRQIIDASKTNIKKLQLELGGKSPDIVFADADLDLAVPGAAMGLFANSGQVCFAGSRILVQRPIAEEFTRRLADYVRNLRVGHALDPKTQIGPVISDKQRSAVLSYAALAKEEGAKPVTDDLSAVLPAKGYFVPPLIFSDVDMSMRIAKEEVFGPLVVIIVFDTEDEAIAIGNQTEYGLAGAVWSRNISTALNVVNRIEAGVMWVNCYGVIDPSVGFHGTKMSGYGAKGTVAHLDTYLTTKSVYIRR